MSYKSITEAINVLREAADTRRLYTRQDRIRGRGESAKVYIRGEGDGYALILVSKDRYSLYDFTDEWQSEHTWPTDVVNAASKLLLG